MASFRLAAFLFIAFVCISLAAANEKSIGDSIADEGRDLLNEGKKKTEGTSEDGKNLFSSFSKKVGEYYDTAMEKSKEALKATGDAISSSYDKLKEKTKELME